MTYNRLPSKDVSEKFFISTYFKYEHLFIRCKLVKFCLKITNTRVNLIDVPFSGPDYVQPIVNDP